MGPLAHRWSVVGFELVDERPMVRRRCLDCGNERTIPAWNRTWTPPDRTRTGPDDGVPA
jgi:hypothetical protein